MRISVLQTNLDSALKIVKPAIGSRMFLPVLSNVLLSSDNGRLRLTATDLELSIQVWIGAKVEQEGAITIPAKNLSDLVKNLSPERIDLELNTVNQKLHLNSGGTKVQLAGISALEFPEIKEVKGVSVTIAGAILQDMVEEVADSAAKFDNHPVLTSIYTNFDGYGVTMASADGYRLTVRKGETYTEFAEAQTILIPVRALQTVAKLIGKGKKAVDIVEINFDVQREVISFNLGDVVVTSTLMSGTFPMYERIIPSAYDTLTTVYRDEFLRACNKAAIFAKDSSNTTRLIITPSIDCNIGTMHIDAKSNGMDEISSMIDASVIGVGINAAFNVQYLVETLKAIADDQVILESITFADPLVIRPAGRDDLLYVIMPMQLSN